MYLTAESYHGMPERLHKPDESRPNVLPAYGLSEKAIMSSSQAAILQALYQNGIQAGDAVPEP